LQHNNLDWPIKSAGLYNIAKELKLLSRLIKEVAAANKIAPDIAVEKFFEDIEKDYDNNLGYESKLVHLKSDIVKTNYELTPVQKSLASKQQVSVALSELSLLGFNDQEIFNLALALQSNVRRVPESGLE
jgi:hypothetical protein